MATLEEIKSQIDGLKPEEQAELAKHIQAKMQGASDLATNLQPTNAKETVTKSLEFEADTFKIDSTGWEVPTEGKFAGEGVKVNPAGDVVEYIGGSAKGEQIFIDYDAFIKHVAVAKGCSVSEAEQKYLLTKQELKTKMQQVDYKQFYEQEIKDHRTGCWYPYGKGFYDIGDRSYVWLVGGNYAGFNQCKWSTNYNNSKCGFGGRLLKN